MKIRRGRTKRGAAYALAGLAVAGTLAVGTVLRLRSTPRPKGAFYADARRERVAFAGCDEMIGEDICGIHADRSEPLRVSVWLPGSAARVLVPKGGADPARPARETDGGWLHEIAVTPNDRSIELAINGEEPTVRIRVEPFTTPPLARRAKAAPKEEAEGLRAPLRALADEARPDERARILVTLASVTARAGDAKAADAVRSEAARVGEASGQKALAARQHLSLVFSHLYQTRDLGAAGAHMAAARALALDAESRAHLSYFEGLVAQESGAIADALRWLTEAAVATRRLGMTDVLWEAAQQRATLLGKVGRFDEALAEYDALSATAATRAPCHRAAFFTSFAWIELSAVETLERPRSMDRAKRLLDEARALFEGPCGTGSRSLPNVLVNQALASLDAGDPEAAARHLDEVKRRKIEVPTYVELWRLEAAARVAVARGRLPEALGHYRTLLDLSERMLAGEASWRALVGEALVQTQLAHRTAAIELLREAERRLDDLLLKVPLGEGRGGFATTREKSARLLIDLLVQEGHAEEATRVARRARVRPLLALARLGRLATLPTDRRRAWGEAIARFLDEQRKLETSARDDWRLAESDRTKAQAERKERTLAARQALADALEALEGSGAADGWSEPTLAAGEVLLGYFPVPGGWLGYARSTADTVVARLPERPPGAPVDDAAKSLPFGCSPGSPTGDGDVAAALPAAQSDWLLAPFARAIAAGTSLRVLAYGALARVDFHALPFDGAPLIARLPIDYPLDLEPAAPTQLASRSEPRVAVLLVADPRGDLPAARDEARALEGLWERRRWPVERALGLEATRGHLLERLPIARIFHYAGHARYGGLEGLDSALPLADGAAISSADILTLGRVPEEVVLTACEAARTDARAAVELGIGQAFVVSGSRSVVAATRSVRDEVAGALSLGFHGSDAGPPRARLREAALAMIRDHPSWDWAAFRALAP